MVLETIVAWTEHSEELNKNRTVQCKKLKGKKVDKERNPIWNNIFTRNSFLPKD